MRKYQAAWIAVTKATKECPAKIRSHPDNYSRIVQAIRKEKSADNRRRNFADPPQPLHGHLVHYIESGVLHLYLELNGDNL